MDSNFVAYGSAEQAARGKGDSMVCQQQLLFDKQY